MAPEEQLFRSNVASTPPAATPLWWFILGGVSVLLIVLIIGLTIALVLLLWQRPATVSRQVPLPSTSQAPTTASQPTSNEQVNDDLFRKGEATAAYLQRLRDATEQTLVGMGSINSLLTGVHLANPRQRWEEWKRAVDALDIRDVDPLAIQYKEDLAKHLEALLLAMDSAPTISELLKEPSLDAILDRAAKVQEGRLATLTALQDFVGFLQSTTPKVKAELEKRYNREMPMLTIH